MNISVDHSNLSSGLPDESVLWPLDNPEFIQHPYPWYAKLRELAPIYKMEDGSYIISRYEDILKWLKHPVMSSVEPENVPENPWHGLHSTLLFMDPPQHTEKRRHLNKWLTPKLVKEWVKAASEHTQAKLDALAKGQVIDAYEEIAVEATHIAICKLLDFPEDEIHPVSRHWFNFTLALRSHPEPWQLQVAAEGFAYLKQRTADLLEYKKQNPGNGLVDELLAKVETGELTYQEVLETLIMIYPSGAHNPGFMIATGIELFAKRPDLLQDYKNKPECRKNFINELIRMNPPELIMSRFPKEDIEIHGVKIPKDAQVQFLLGSANYDEQYFEHPYEFDLNRSPEHSMNLSFGIGPHSCVGQILSRAECESIFNVIAEHCERIEFVGEPVVTHTERVRSYTGLNVIFHQN